MHPDADSTSNSENRIQLPAPAFLCVSYPNFHTLADVQAHLREETPAEYMISLLQRMFGSW